MSVVDDRRAAYLAELAAGNAPHGVYEVDLADGEIATLVLEVPIMPGETLRTIVEDLGAAQVRASRGASTIYVPPTRKDVEALKSRSALERANEARAYYATPEGRRERLATLLAEAAKLGAEIDRRREEGRPIPFKLRERLRRTTDKATAAKAAQIREEQNL